MFRSRFSGFLSHGSWSWTSFEVVKGKMNVGQIIYLDRARIFRRLRFSLRIRFLRHFALMVQQDWNLKRIKRLKQGPMKQVPKTQP